MSAATVLSAIGNDLTSFYKKLSCDFQKARQAWLIISSAQTRAVLLTVGADAIKTVKDATAAVAGSGLSFSLDAAVVADIQKLVAEAKAGDGVLMDDLKALGVAV